MRKATLLLVLGTMMLAGNALAQDEAAEESTGGDMKEAAGVRASGGPGYGPAGCGLGSLVFAPDSGFTQIFAATTNATSYSQTFGITSGTSNCDDSGGGSESAKAFVEANRTALAKDIARGRGETISSLSELAGCGNSAAVGQSLQRNFKRIFPNAKVKSGQVSDNVVQVLKGDKTLVCGNLG